jgi:hypothetical protein
MDALKLGIFASCFMVLVLCAGCSKSKTKLDAHVDYEHDIFVTVLPVEEIK